jgi:hypothetical protein
MKSLSYLVVMLVACAGTQEEGAKPTAGVPPPTTKPTASGDVSFEIPAIEIKASPLEPDALGRPGMPLVDPKKPIPLDKIGGKEWAQTVAKQRALVTSTKDPITKQAQAAVLATMLYRESKTNKANEKALLADARQVLRDVAQFVGDKQVDEITLRLLGSYELLLDDYPAAEKAWLGVVERDKDTKNKEAPYNRAWLVYSLLKQFKNAEALAAIGGEKLDERQPELAYVTAWAKWRTGDAAGAWQAMATAVRGWGQNANRDDLEHEVLLLASRTNVSFDQALTLLVNALAKAKLQQYEAVAKLGLSGYGSAGRWSDGVAALDKAVEIAGDTVPPNDRPVIRYEQADFTTRIDAPDVAAKYAKQSIEALAACGAKCSAKDKADTVQGVYLMGRLFHILYATANDHRYYEPAHDLYSLTIPMLDDSASRTQAERDAKVLETTLRNTKVGTGTHDKGALNALLVRHNAEIETCYTSGLGANPKLAGSISIALESDATGGIKGVATEPKAGQADLSAVAGCVAEKVKQWKLPKRGMPGNTRIKMSYTLARK